MTVFGQLTGEPVAGQLLTGFGGEGTATAVPYPYSTSEGLRTKDATYQPAEQRDCSRRWYISRVAHGSHLSSTLWTTVSQLGVNGTILTAAQVTNTRTHSSQMTLRQARSGSVNGPG